MKLWKSLLLAGVFALAGCSIQNNETTEKINVLVPQGAPALATVSIYNNEYANVTTVSGSDVVTSELAKKDSEYDVIIAPINLGAKMIENGNTNYRLDAVVTWGNLYIVGSDAYKEGDAFAAFGENAVPAKILEKNNWNQNVTYFNSVQDVQAQILSGKFQAGLMAEPAVTATLGKAKEKGLKLQVIKDLQNTDGKQKGYPQAAVFVKEGKVKQAQDALAKIASFLNEESSNQEQLKTLINQAGAENLGVPNADIAVASWQRQNLRYVKAKDCETEIADFLSLFNITYQDTMLSK